MTVVADEFLVWRWKNFFAVITDVKMLYGSIINTNNFDLLVTF
jgi:hypothetical protein